MKSKRAISPRRTLEVWKAYSEFRRGQIAPSTYKRDYQKVQRLLEKMVKQSPFLTDAIAVRDWLMSHYAAETARRVIMQLNAACSWAEDSEMLKTNPYKGLQRQIRVKKPSDKAWAAFTIPERDRIIQAFEVENPYYAPWVKFLFYTGCRPEEAAALRWEHVSEDCTEVLFVSAEPYDTRDTQPTKNGKTTRFPCNARLQRLLREIRPEGYTRGDRVFVGKTGDRFSSTAPFRPSQIVRYFADYDLPTLALLTVRSPRRRRRLIWHYLTVWSQVKSPLDGNDLKRLGYKPGKQFKPMLDRLLAATLDGELNGDLETLRQQAEQLLAQQFSQL